MQNLKIPFERPIISAGYKNSLYYKQFGFNHYGWDLGDRTSREIKSPGYGSVIDFGMDGNSDKERLGNVIILLFPECYNEQTKRYEDVVCRMYHLASFSSGIKKGSTLKAGEVIGIYGNTGANTTGPHLHIEFDSDTKYPQYAYGVASGGKIIKHGTVDSSINPGYLLKGNTLNIPDKNWVNEKEIEYYNLSGKNDSLENLISDIEIKWNKLISIIKEN